MERIGEQPKPATFLRHEAATLAASDSFVRRWLVPVLLAITLQLTIRQHSWAPGSTLPVATANISVLAATLLLLCHLLFPARFRVSRPAVIILFALIASAAYSTIASDDPSRSFTRLRLYASIALLGASIYLINREQGQQIPLTAYLAVVGLLHLPYVLDVVLWMRDAQGVFWAEGVRVPHFSNVRHFAQLCFLAGSCSLALSLTYRKLAFSGFAMTCIALFGILASGSRGALLAWVAFAVLLASMSLQRWRTSLIAASALVISATVVWQLHTTRVLESPNLFVRVMSSGIEDISSGRNHIWIDSLAKIAERPFFGHGPEAYRISGCCNRTVFQSHNFVLQFVMEFGIVGCALFLLLAWKLVSALGGPARIWRTATNCTETAILLSMLGAFLAFAMIDGLLYHPVPLMAFATICGLLAASLYNQDAARRGTTRESP